MGSHAKRIKTFWLIWDRVGIVAIFLFVAVIFAILEPRVLQPDQLLSVLNRSSWVAVAAIGMTFAICSGGFDLSVGSIFSLSGCLLAKLIMDNGLSTGTAMLITLLVALCCGVLNGLLITKLKIQPFVATLSTMLVFGGVVQTYTKNIGTRIDTEQYERGLSWLGRGAIFGFIPSKIFVVVALFILAIAVYRNTGFGIKVRAVGSNDLAARTSGINADSILVIVYTLTAVTAAMASMLYTSTMQSASPGAGSGFELDAITAVVLGGTALSGGKGNLAGTFIGAFLVAFTKMCLNFISAPEAMHVIVTGAILLLALSISGIKLITQRVVT
ncbi:MAG: ABC transporter permease [Clostridiales bacterium]|nr:ABC transporter permease [Clostridiales bacterium]